MATASDRLKAKVSLSGYSNKMLSLFACKKQKLRYTSLIPILFVLRTITVFIMMRKKGYSGVAIYCKKQPDKIISGTSWLDADAEGRFIEAQFGNLSVISLYLPSGSSGEDRQAFYGSFHAVFTSMHTKWP
jgi:exodeoxyribonuclease-3